MENVIRITGKGNLKIAPDQIVIEINFKVFGKTYELSSTKAEAVYQDAISRIIGCSIEANDIKTTLFSIEVKHLYNPKTENREFIGYQTNHFLELTIPLDHSLLGLILKSLEGLEVSPEVEIHYSIEDAESLKNDLLVTAVHDSKLKAQILSGELDCDLGDVASIDYSWGEVSVYSNTSRGYYLGASIQSPESYGDYGFNPKDIEVEETVTVVWNISRREIAASL